MDLVKVEHRNIRVLTSEQLADAYMASARNISDNFNNHRERFIEGKHYFYLYGEELRLFKNQSDNIGLVDKHASSLYLWTEKGALRHAKILDTDRAWEVYEKLEDSYFRIKEIVFNTDKFSPQLQLLINMEMEHKKLKEDVIKNREYTESVKKDINNIREAVIINPGENWRRDTNIIMGKICRALSNYKTPKDQVYRALEERGKCKLNIRLNNLKSRALLEGYPKSKVNKMNYLDVIANDAKLKEIYIAIVKEMAVKQGI